MPKKPGYFDRFMGLWSRGAVDSCPSDHFSDCLNVRYLNAKVETREGSSNVTSAASATGIQRIHIYKPNPPYAGTDIPRPLIMYDGAIYDYLKNNVVPIEVGLLGDRDFSLVNFFGRAYFVVNKGTEANTLNKIRVYDGTGPGGVRDAGGAVPINPPVYVSTVAGSLGLGKYLISYAYETKSGFITQPAPFINQDSLGVANAFNLTIPVGPAYVAARWVIASKALPFGTFNGNYQGYPIFFVGRIPDNVTTAYLMSFFDENLRDSADYLFDRLVSIPAGITLAEYNGRLISMGEYAQPSVIRASEIGEPESFSSSSGFQTTDPTESGGLKSGVDFRGTFFAFKEQRAYYMQDTGDEISTWQILSSDKAYGTNTFGISQVLDAKGAASQGFIIADKTGLILFNGIFQDIPLTYKIDNIWKRVNQNLYNLIQVAVDPTKKRIYALVPLDAAPENSHVIIGDFSEGLNYRSIKWAIWTLNGDPNSMAIYTDYSGGATIKTIFGLKSAGAKLITINDNNPINDSGVKIDSFIEFPPVRFSDGISHFNFVRIRAYGVGTLSLTAYGEDKVASVPLASIVTTNNPGREYAQLVNLVSEQSQLKIASTNLNDYFRINKVIYEGNPLWDERPR